MVLYQVYDDEAALQEHLRTKHCAAFDRGSRVPIESGAVIEAGLIFSGAN